MNPKISVSLCLTGGRVMRYTPRLNQISALIQVVRGGEIIESHDVREVFALTDWRRTAAEWGGCGACAGSLWPNQEACENHGPLLAGGLTYSDVLTKAWSAADVAHAAMTVNGEETKVGWVPTPDASEVAQAERNLGQPLTGEAADWFVGAYRTRWFELDEDVTDGYNALEDSCQDSEPEGDRHD